MNGVSFWTYLDFLAVLTQASCPSNAIEFYVSNDFIVGSAGSADTNIPRVVSLCLLRCSGGRGRASAGAGAGEWQ